MQGANIIVKVLIAITVVFAFTSCANMAVTGATAVYNHKSWQKSLGDNYISLQANHVVNRPMYKDTNVSIAVLNSEVLLTGEVPNVELKNDAGARIKDIDGVTRVYNLLTVQGTSSSLTRMSDTWITAKVKSKLIASNELDATQVKVVTENGVVYLMGTLLPEEAAAATDIASNTDGVTSVVKLFSYIKITKTLS